MSRIGCVSEADLRALLLGELPEPLARSVSLHLEICSRCAEAARDLDGLTDPFVHALRQVVPPTAHEPDTAAASGRQAASPPLTPPRWVADYRLLEELGRGGMSVVYKAQQAHPERVVALKMILAGSHTEPSRRARFLAEADAIARLQHPRIVQIYESGEHDGLPFLALEFMEGGSLARRLGGRPQPPREAAGLLEALAMAVDYAHSQGVVHRDLKPANVLLTRDGQPKLADFGLAKFADNGLTASGVVLGTPAYMAPEQAIGDNGGVGPAADIYSLGAILYELLTGQPPFRAATPLETLVQALSREPVPPDHRQRLPRDLTTICLKCLQKDPAHRYPCAASWPRTCGVTRPIGRSGRDLLPPASALAMVSPQSVGRGAAAGHRAAPGRRAGGFDGGGDPILAAGPIRVAGGGLADRHAAEAQATVDFLIKELIAAASPSGKAGRTVTVDEILARRAGPSRADSPTSPWSRRRSITRSAWPTGTWASSAGRRPRTAGARVSGSPPRAGAPADARFGVPLRP